MRILYAIGAVLAFWLSAIGPANAQDGFDRILEILRNHGSLKCDAPENCTAGIGGIDADFVPFLSTFHLRGLFDFEGGALYLKDEIEPWYEEFWAVSLSTNQTLKDQYAEVRKLGLPTMKDPGSMLVRFGYGGGTFVFDEAGSKDPIIDEATGEPEFGLVLDATDMERIVLSVVEEFNFDVEYNYNFIDQYKTVSNMFADMQTASGDPQKMFKVLRTFQNQAAFGSKVNEAVNFILFHELGHFALGHNALPENDCTTKAGKTAFTQRENDADLYAAIMQAEGFRMARLVSLGFDGAEKRVAAEGDPLISQMGGFLASGQGQALLQDDGYRIAIKALHTEESGCETRAIKTRLKPFSDLEKTKNIDALIANYAATLKGRY